MAEENQNQPSLEDLERQLRELRQFKLTLVTQISDIGNTLPLLLLLFLDLASITFLNILILYCLLSNSLVSTITSNYVYVFYSIMLYIMNYKELIIQLNIDPIKVYTTFYKHPLFYIVTVLITVYTNTLYISVYLLYFAIFYLCLFIFCIIVSKKKRMNSNNYYHCFVLIPIILSFAFTIIFMGEISEHNYSFQTATQRGTVIAITFICSMILFYLYVGFEAENSSLVISISNELLIYLAPIIYTLFIIFTTYSFLHSCFYSSFRHTYINQTDNIFYDDIIFDEDVNNNNLDIPLLQEESEEN